MSDGQQQQQQDNKELSTCWGLVYDDIKTTNEWRIVVDAIRSFLDNEPTLTILKHEVLALRIVTALVARQMSGVDPHVTAFLLKYYHMKLKIRLPPRQMSEAVQEALKIRPAIFKLKAVQKEIYDVKAKFASLDKEWSERYHAMRLDRHAKAEAKSRECTEWRRLALDLMRMDDDGAPTPKT